MTDSNVDEILSNEFESLNINKNKGTGAGGSNTNLYGKRFENKTDNEPQLLNNGFIKCDEGYCYKELDDRKITYIKQHDFKKYMKSQYKKDTWRLPDEAYIIEKITGEKIIKILEKKEQRVNGSVEDKLWNGPTFKDSYYIMLEEEFEVHYAYCVNDFLKNKLLMDKPKYMTLKKIYEKNDIHVLYGDDEDYFITLFNWINNC